MGGGGTKSVGEHGLGKRPGTGRKYGGLTERERGKEKKKMIDEGKAAKIKEIKN